MEGYVIGMESRRWRSDGNVEGAIVRQGIRGFVPLLVLQFCLLLGEFNNVVQNRQEGNITWVLRQAPFFHLGQSLS